MMEKFTDQARRVIVLAQEEATTHNHTTIGTEHLLLGLLREGHSAATQALESLGLDLETVRQQIEEIIGQGSQAPAEHMPFTSRAKKVLELSLREALSFGQDHIGPEHILLGLLREGGGVAAQVLVSMGADLSQVRVAVVQLLYSEPPASSRDRQQARVHLPPPSLAEKVRQLSEEIEQLRNVLRRHGINPDEDTA